MNKNHNIRYLLVGVLIGFAVCYGLGWFFTPYHPVEESKLGYVALKEHPERLQPQTREYLKARLYWNAAHWVRPSWMAGWEIDFGPVDDSALGGLDATKDVTSTSDIYRDALSKHGITPNSQ